jgi:tRNA (adenine57-N1/adenine58-N1)-methyltransferase
MQYIIFISGTGSGSLSHALLRTITPGGYLHTYDFHEQRVDKAREEFTDHGFKDSVTVTHRDVLVDGFDLVDVADAVFLDLPAPWDAIPHAKKALKKTGAYMYYDRL